MNKKLLIALNLMGTLSFADGSSDISKASSNCDNDCTKSCVQSINLWQPHSFMAYSSRDIIQKRTFFNTESHRTEGVQGFFSIATEYMQNFGNKCGDCKNLGARPFWSGTNTMTYGTNDGDSQIDAYQFGMGNVTGQGTISLNPKIQHVGADMMLYFTKRKDERGFFLTLKAPLGAMMINPQLTENPIANPDDKLVTDDDHVWQSYPATTVRYQTLTEAWQAGSSSGNSISPSRANGIILSRGKMSACRQTVIRMADLTAVLGYKAYGSEKGFVDIGFKVTCPTGNIATGQYVLEPIFGRAGHWFVGGEVTAHYKLWESDKCGDKGIDFWMQGDVGHLFAGRADWRSFDLKQNGPGSKYLLIQNYFPTNPTDDNPTGRVASFITQAVNVTTIPVRSKFAVEGTFAAAFDMYKDNWNLLIGGEFWGRSKECLSFDCCDLVSAGVVNLNDFAVVGRQISAYTPDSSTDIPVTVLNLCEPLAKINQSQNAFLEQGGDSGGSNVDPNNLPEGIASALDAKNRIPANLSDALDVAGASSATAMTGKLFGQFGYTFKEHRYTPNLSVIGGAEFNPKGNNAVSLWSVGLQGSLNF